MNGRFVLVTIGLGPYCLTPWSDDLHPRDWVTTLCGTRGVAGASGRLVEAYVTDPIHDVCRQLARGRRHPSP